MSPVSKKEYIQAILRRYHEADRFEKSRILDEFCRICGYHRKHAITKLSPSNRLRKSHRKPGRPSRYAKPEILMVLACIWQTAHYPCSKRLKAILANWIMPYEKAFGNLLPWVKEALANISPATIDRLLTKEKLRVKRKGLSTTKPGTLLKHHIPIKTHQWDESTPGFLEADTVAHCGSSAAGQFALTLDITDIATGWTEQRALWGKGQRGILAQTASIEDALPFPILGFDCDNGTEFLHWHLVKYFQERHKPVQFTRSRPYKKDDNAHIEQKNYTHVRQWLGYLRFDNPASVELLNDLYTADWRLFHNFFLPSTKLLKKLRLRSKIIKKHDNPKTPYQRLLESNHIPQHIKDKLTALYQTLNPFQLRKTIDQKIQAIKQLAR
jgi:hypothetical protein